ncbi:lantibiotic dehydratase [Chitinophaga nivalis]|uniref:Lantibiotic dehydratase n=1 Tax=Chitinophaga nivalis TaxID=2991709 RepID=A0ABT3INN3_9BACT|nr:lantibiotic dehydratase [Chitinophaga nivalis]MCW3464757.1 lantibiotic dehydratase [Chitinophaga nivalis]MCW3485552.1 lantibiotic dehydratase [Chitinophaga nivalis]
MSIPYQFHDQLILRTPRLPYHEQYNEAYILQLMADTAFMESIYLASPVLYEACRKYQSGHITDTKEISKLVISLAKYYSRMSARCTPFGLFSSCSPVSWTTGDTRIQTDERPTGRHTRLDMHYLCILSAHLTSLPFVREYLFFYPNNSIYYVEEEIRYAEYQHIKDNRVYQISAVNHTPAITGILELARTGATYQSLSQSLVTTEISISDATGFIDQLIETQLLVSELEPNVTGVEYAFSILHCLQRIFQETAHPDLAKMIQLLQQACNMLRQLDDNQVNDVAAYKAIVAVLKELQAPFEENKLFQTDLIRTATGGVDQTLQQDILQAFKVLNAINQEADNAHLSSFIQRFTERYEDRPMPLLTVLDAEYGIGYPENTGQDTCPLIEELLLPEASENIIQVKYNKVENWLLEKLVQATANGDYKVDISLEETDTLPVSWKDLPASLSVMFKIITPDAGSILIDIIAGASATNILSRFAHASDGISRICTDIIQQEEQLNPHVLMAQIIHLPESRLGNILLHPQLTTHEIPYLTKAAVDTDHQLTTDDLYVTIVDNRIVLYSQKLQREVIPRLHNSHNYKYKALPVYQFLCDLQTQQLRSSLYFNWGNMATRFSFLPRVTVGRVVLFTASWYLKEPAILEIIQHLESESANAVTTVREKWKFPRHILLADGDNELLVDFENTLSISVFIKSIRKRTAMLLKEFLHQPEDIITGASGSYVNQFIASLIKTTPVYTSVFSPMAVEQVAATAARKFNIGSSWLYFKLYCGTKAADRLLQEIIRPLVQQLSAAGLIGKWFFIRYYDPHFHIRFRIQLTDNAHLDTCIRLVTAFLEPFQQEDIIWKTQLDTYHRELERYGIHTMDLSESLFAITSNMVIDFLNISEGDAREDYRWLWGMRATDELLNAFGYTLSKKAALMETLKELFGKEFRMDKSLRSQLNARYSRYRTAISAVMATAAAGNPLTPLIESIAIHAAALTATGSRITQLQQQNAVAYPEDLLSSHIHMLLNRLFTSRQRLHELVMYDFLYRYYHSRCCRMQKEQPENMLSEIIS